MQVCPNQHTCCLKCIDRYIFAKEDEVECFNCRVAIRRDDVTRNRLLHNIRVTATELRGTSVNRMSKIEAVSEIASVNDKSPELTMAEMERDALKQENKELKDKLREEELKVHTATEEKEALLDERGQM